MERLPQKKPSREGSARSGSPADCVDLPSRADRSGDQAANDARMTQLARAIEREIIPRLMLAHRSAPEPARPRQGEVHDAITRNDVLHFAKLMLSQDEDLAFQAVDRARSRGVSVERIYVDLLGPTARYLGELWEEDLCTFTDVTLGLGRLQRVLRELSPAFGRGVDHPADGRRVLLLPSPGEQHTFGLVMVTEFFRRAGWDVVGGAWAQGDDAVDLVAKEWFDVVGFSLGATVHLAPLRRCIAAVRHAACNRHVVVLVGGPMFGLHPEYLDEVGADGMATDGGEAPVLAERLIVQVARH